jgi:hypothetical protein
LVWKEKVKIEGGAIPICTGFFPTEVDQLPSKALGHLHWIIMLLKSGIFHRCVALLPFTLTAQKPLERAYPANPISLGDHLKKKRLDLGLFQKDVSAAIATSLSSAALVGRGPGTKATQTSSNKSLPKIGKVR